MTVPAIVPVCAEAAPLASSHVARRKGMVREPEILPNGIVVGPRARRARGESEGDDGGTLAGGRTRRERGEGDVPRGGMGCAATSRVNIGKPGPPNQIFLCATEIFGRADLSIRTYAQRNLDSSLRPAGADRLRRHPAASHSNGARGGGRVCLVLRLAIPRGPHRER